MVWQDAFPRPGQHVDVEQERELRLAAQAAAGADWALAALVARYQPPVTRYLTRLIGDPDVARAEAEQIFVRMDRRLRGPHGGANLRLWLLRASTEAGLNLLQQPRRAAKPQLAGPGQPIGLLAGETAHTAKGLRASLDTLATLTGTTARQVRRLVWSGPSAGAEASEPSKSAEAAQEADGPAPTWGSSDEALDEQDPRTALRHRLARAVLAELPYGDAQCLALHLVAGLNQREVARALGITPSAVRRRVVQGLQLFARRYEAAVASLGLPPEVLQEPEPVAEVAEPDEVRDEMMVTGEVAAVSAPLPYPPDELTPAELPAEPSSPLAAATAADFAGGEAPQVEPATAAAGPVAGEAPQEIIVDADPPPAWSVTAADAPDSKPDGAMTPTWPAEPAGEALPVGGPRVVPVLTHMARGNGVSAAPRPETAPRVIPVLTSKAEPAPRRGGILADTESLEPLAADLAMSDPDDGDDMLTPADRELASAALSGPGGLPAGDATLDL